MESNKTKTEKEKQLRLEDERQKQLKRTELRQTLVNSEFRIKGECAISVVMTKLHVIDTMCWLELNRNVIQMKSGRMKSFDSVCKKLQKKELPLEFPVAVEKINDLIGVRAICAYVDDIYRVAEMVEKQKDIRIVKVKDYIKQPKKSGYQSLHLLLDVAISEQNGTQWMKVELQLRTAAMDYWANLDHQLRYKRGRKEADSIDEELRKCAEDIGQLDYRMMEIRKKIDKI